MKPKYEFIVKSVKRLRSLLALIAKNKLVFPAKSDGIFIKKRQVNTLINSTLQNHLRPNHRINEKFIQVLHSGIDNLLGPIRRNTLPRIGLWATFALIKVSQLPSDEPAKTFGLI
jgi:hypothetical protein